MTYYEEYAKREVSKLHDVKTEEEATILIAAIAGAIKEMYSSSVGYDMAVTAERIAVNLLEKLSEDSVCRINCYEGVFLPIKRYAEAEGYKF